MGAIATEALAATMRKYASAEEIALVQRAYEFAHAGHGDQVRKSGEPYIIHPYEVALVLAQLEDRLAVLLERGVELGGLVGHGEDSRPGRLPFDHGDRGRAGRL